MVSPRLVGLMKPLATGCWLSALTMIAAGLGAQERPRARDVGIVVGTLPTGPNNAITDVPGVLVGHQTLAVGDSVNTGVTAILPHGGDLFHDRVPAAVHVINGFGKLVGIAQVQELGELETPILLTCTLCVWRAADALAGYLLAAGGMEDVRSINVVVGETNDGRLNDIRSRPIQPEHVRAALENARDGAVPEGSVGAGRGTVAFGWKGGIGTSSRRIAAQTAPGSYTAGVLVQSNFGGNLTIAGVPVGRELARPGRTPGGSDADGSIMIVIATDAPLSPANLERVARRAAFGLARTGSYATSGSGDFVIAFSTAGSVRRRRPGPDTPTAMASAGLTGDQLNPLFQAVAEATEEAIYNSLLGATSVTYRGRTVNALPLAETLEILDRHNARSRSPQP